MSDSLRCKLLLFEDDPGIRTMLTTFFTSLGASMVAVADGRHALERIEREAPDLLLLDVIMPFQDGLDVLRAVRAVNRQLPVIMLTERCGIDDRITGLDLGADDYVTKPFSPRELASRVQALLRRCATNHQPAGAIITAGPLHINTATREIKTHTGNLLSLTKTEFDLLAYLASHQDAVVSHGDLLQKVLGYDPDTETKSLVMHIANIRRKLERLCPEALTIKAIAGVGYRLLVNFPIPSPAC